MMLTLPNVITTALAFGMPGGTEWIILLVLGLLIFGRRLPEVGRSLGRGIVEFKRGVKGIEEDIDSASGETRSDQQLEERPSTHLEERPAQQEMPKVEENPYATGG